MEQRKLGFSGLMISSVGLGANNFGRRLDYEGTEKVIKTSIDSGVNFINTANIYSIGESESFIGKALKGHREEVVLATKGGGKMGPGPNEGGNSRKHLTDQINASLKRLDTDYIDLYQIHFPDESTHIQETLQTLDDAIRQGKILYVGCSNFQGWQISQAMEISNYMGLEKFVSIQPEYNLTNREIENEIIPAAKEYNLGIIPYYPLASGILTGKYHPGSALPEGTRIATMPDGPYKDKFLNDRNFKLLGLLEPFAQSLGHTISELAVAWLLAREQVASVITGATKPEQIESNAKAAEWTLSTDELSEIDSLIAGI